MKRQAFLARSAELRTHPHDGARPWVVVPCLAILLLLACTSSDPGESSVLPATPGRLHVSLVTPSLEQFRLRNALFEVTSRNGASLGVLDSEAAPEAVALELSLPQDVYELLLEDGWALERLAADGTAEPVLAALLTPNPTPFEVLDERVTEVVYSFTTSEGVVSFGQGEVNVSVNVTRAVSGAPCSVLDRSSCAAGQTCLLEGSGAGTFCADAGSLPVGSACSSEQCVAGAQCLQLEGASAEQAVCTRFCNPASLFCGCRSLSFDAGVGVCPSPGAPSPCDPLTQQGCEAGEVCHPDGGGTCGPGLRLVSSLGEQSAGRLELFFDGQWGTVCDDGFDDVDASVACRELGFGAGTFIGNDFAGSGPIWLDDLGCTGSEARLVDCLHLPIGSHNCSHGEDTAVRCF